MIPWADLQVHIQTSPISAGWAVWLYWKDRGKVRIVKPITLEYEDLAEGAILPSPSLIIQGDLLAALKKELDRHGIKSDAEAKNEGQIKAQSRHLEDLRSLLFKTLKTKAPR